MKYSDIIFWIPYFLTTATRHIAHKNTQGTVCILITVITNK